MSLLKRLPCLFGHHRREPGLVRDVGTGFHSRCIGCGRTMVRGDAVWTVLRKKD